MKLLLTHCPFAALIMAILFVVMPAFATNDQCEAPYPDQSPFNGPNCDIADAFAWSNTVDNLTEGQTADITITGGVGQYTWKIIGTGFHFIDAEGNSQTELITTDKSVTIQSSVICGAADISVSDQCDKSIKHTVRSVQGTWTNLGCFEPVNHRESGPHPYLDPRTLGMWNSSQTVGYWANIPGYGTRFSGQYAIQIAGYGPQIYHDFGFYTGNSWGWAYHDDSLVDAPESFFMDPIVGVFKIRAFGGTQIRNPTLHKYYCGTDLCVWEWTCGQ